LPFALLQKQKPCHFGFQANNQMVKELNPMTTRIKQAGIFLRGGKQCHWLCNA